jgi:hypothetical protein
MLIIIGIIVIQYLRDFVKWKVMEDVLVEVGLGEKVGLYGLLQNIFIVVYLLWSD